MEILYRILLGLGVFVAIVFTALVYLTGKGDAMSGGSTSVRTTFKGKASFDDKISQFTLMLGIGFMVLCLALNVLAHQLNP